MDLLTGNRGAAPRAALVVAALVLATGLAACPRDRPAEQGGPGRRLVAGAPKALLASADGAWLAMLDGCVEVKGRYLPLGTSTCDLKVLSTAGGEARLVARGVPTLPHGAAFAPVGSGLAALADYDFEAGAGSLVLVQAGTAREVARGVTFHGFVPDGSGAVAVVSAGRLLLLGPDGERRGQHGGSGFGSFELRRRADGAVVGLARTQGAHRGALFGVDLGHLDRSGAPIAEGTADFSVAPGGRAIAYSVAGRRGTELFLGDLGLRPARVADGTRTFAFASDGSALAWISDAAPGRQGDLMVATPGGTPLRLGREVGEYRWATAATRLAWLERYDPRGRAGVLGVGGPGAPPRTLGKNVTDFEISPDGGSVAFLRHTVEGGYSVDLWAGLASGEPRRLARGVFGFSFAPDGRWLYYRTRCTRNGDACDLERVAAGGGAEAPAQEVARGVKSFEFDPRDPDRLLLTWQRADLAALDFGLWRAGTAVPLDRGALPGSIRFLGPDSRRVVYAVVEPKRAGTYLIPVPVPE